MSSHLDFEGLYDPKKMFAVTNWSDEDFSVDWNDPGPDGTGSNIYTLHVGETRTYPQYLAYYITKNFVDREMYRDANKEPLDSKQRERLEMATANRDARKPYEDKTMQEVREGQEDPAVTAMRAKIRNELIIEQQKGITNQLTPETEEFPAVSQAKTEKKSKNKASEAAAGI